METLCNFEKSSILPKIAGLWPICDQKFLAKDYFVVFSLRFCQYWRKWHRDIARMHSQEGLWLQREGRRVLPSDKPRWEGQQEGLNVWKIYNILKEVESFFRCMKTDLDLRPVYHKNDVACLAHLHLGILAYWAVTSIRYQLRQKGINKTGHRSLTSCSRINLS